MRREKIEAEVEFRPKGLGELKAKWGDFAGDLLEPMVLLTAGATKAQAAWAGMRGIFESRVLGPLGLVAGASVAFLATTRVLVGQWRALGSGGMLGYVFDGEVEKAAEAISKALEKHSLLFKLNPPHQLTRSTRLSCDSTWETYHNLQDGRFVMFHILTHV